jgi:alpha-mannosidase
VIDLGFHRDGAGFQAEGLVWTDDGPLQGIHPRRTAVPLPDAPPGSLTLVVEAASNPAFPAFRPTPLGSLDTAGEQPLYRLRTAELALRDEGVYGLLLDIEVLFGLLRALPPDEPRRHRLLRDIEATLDLIDMRDVPASAPAARVRLRDALDAPSRASSLRVIAVGHAHIDTAWLWPIRETVRKCARTFASAVRLMDEDPSYVFTCSQAAQYAWMEQLYPELFERIRAKVATGQFVPVGGMWVEADMNLPSGESIVRQLVHGQRWFESRFGARCSEVWIPDVFGYPASLPQIFAAGGCTRFVTQKLSWNKQNRFPHNTFWWEGIDGTKVLTHFPPVDTYNAEVQPSELRFSEANFRDAGWSRWALMPYGYGNGGGGPTREMLQRSHRMADLDGVPRIIPGTAADFFAAVEAEIEGGARVPEWRGELYFEMHRGTLTSQSRTKVGNRSCERLFREFELWSARTGEVPADVATELDLLWKDVLVQQFHDILPGSSIAWVHADAEATHARVAARLEELLASLLSAATKGEGSTVANAATHARREVIDVDGAPAIVEVAGSALATVAAVTTTERVVTTEQSMSNGHVCVRWDADGTITSIIDMQRAREVLPTERSITLEAAPDHPVEYDAWDLESWTRGLGRPIRGGTARLVEQHALRAALRVTRTFGASTITQTVTLRAGSSRVDVELDVDWQEDETLLSMFVPLDVRSDVATCDIQFGNVRRPTHASSPWDAAKFEVCAHRYVDISEPSFGVAVLNDGRYGHSVFDGGIRVSLLRAARYPDPTADRGRHRVTLSILPHGPGLHEVLAEAEALNMPLRVVPGAVTAGSNAGVVTVGHPGVQLSAVKLADDGSGDLVVRLHEALGDRSQVSISTPRAITGAARCTLLEEPIATTEALDGIVTLTLRPFELVTLRLTHSTALVGAVQPYSGLFRPYSRPRWRSATAA